jgi:hypothetical protein
MTLEPVGVYSLRPVSRKPYFPYRHVFQTMNKKRDRVVPHFEGSFMTLGPIVFIQGCSPFLQLCYR